VKLYRCYVSYRSYSFGESGLRDALCGRIPQKFTTIILTSDYLPIVFEYGSNFDISLNDCVGAEAIIFPPRRRKDGFGCHLVKKILFQKCRFSGQIKT
jgi:hypothetical protein